MQTRYKELKSGNFSVYLEYTINGERQYDFLNIQVSKDYSKITRVNKVDVDNINLVKKIKAQKELELFGLIHESAVPHGQNQLCLISYIESSPKYKTANGYKGLVNKLRGYTSNNTLPFAMLSARFLKDFFDFMELGIARNSAISYMDLLKASIKRAKKEGLIFANPFLKYKMPPRHETEISYLELHELRKLKETPYNFEPQIAQAFFFSCFTGLRFSDIKELRYSSFKIEQLGESEENINLTITPYKTDSTTGKLLQIPLSNQAVYIVGDIRDKEASSLVFEKFPSSPTVWHKLQEWVKDAGINKKVHFHVGRHTFATMCLTSGIDIHTVSKLLGHSTVEKTEVYAKIIDKKMVQEISKFPELI